MSMISKTLMFASLFSLWTAGFAVGAMFTPEEIVRIQAKDKGILVRSVAGDDVLTFKMVAPTQTHALDLVERLGRHSRFEQVTYQGGDKTELGYQFTMVAHVKPKPKPERDRSDGAFVAAVEFLKQRLNDPYSAKFPSSRDAVIVKKKNQMYGVRSWVRAKNKFGAYVKRSWVVVVQYEDGYWNLRKLEWAD